MDALLIGLFAFLGGVTRYSIGVVFPCENFPLGTMLINLTGSFLLAFLTSTLARKEHFPAPLTLALGTGFVGAYTTFSTFTLELLKLFLSHAYLHAFFYAFGSLAGGVLMAGLGVWGSDRLIKGEARS